MTMPVNKLQLMSSPGYTRNSKWRAATLSPGSNMAAHFEFRGDPWDKVVNKQLFAFRQKG